MQLQILRNEFRKLMMEDLPKLINGGMHLVLVRDRPIKEVEMTDGKVVYIAYSGMREPWHEYDFPIMTFETIIANAKQIEVAKKIEQPKSLQILLDSSP